MLSTAKEVQVRIPRDDIPWQWLRTLDLQFPLDQFLKHRRLPNDTMPSNAVQLLDLNGRSRYHATARILRSWTSSLRGSVNVALRRPIRVSLNGVSTAYRQNQAPEKGAAAGELVQSREHTWVQPEPGRPSCPDPRLHPCLVMIFFSSSSLGADDAEISKLLKAKSDSCDGLEATRRLFSMKTISWQFFGHEGLVAGRDVRLWTAALVRRRNVCSESYLSLPFSSFFVKSSIFFSTSSRVFKRSCLMPSNLS